MEEAIVATATATAIPAQEAKVIVIDERSPIREKEVEIHMVEAEEAEALIEAEVACDELAEFAHRSISHTMTRSLERCRMLAFTNDSQATWFTKFW
ncbi:uncharacterized protein A4U43_C09F9750 [Asparagus officinalis]|uniref:Uncharacterized protein n=1 Tax=Asparagus officinalis TaxID=4686 RepID=A0A5P1EBB7_ASPOF|nr:uncharacterized protein A4U43_C09F9750 [Asparagus officinalis]